MSLQFALVLECDVMLNLSLLEFIMTDVLIHGGQVVG